MAPSFSDAFQMTTSELKVITGKIRSQLIDRIDEFANRLERSRESIVNEPLTAWVNLEYCFG